MFIVFEGIDGSGKSTLSKRFAKKYNFDWTKEPTFSSEEADKLNLGSKDDVEREVEFCIDRIKHQNSLRYKSTSIVCDRYIWSGLAYSKLFNPSAFEFAKAMYKHDFFIKPDFYVFVNTPIDLCYERKKTQTIEQLTSIKEAYLKTREFVETDSKIIETKGFDDLDNNATKIWKEIHDL